MLQKKYINEFVSKMVPDELHLVGLQKIMLSIFDHHRSPYYYIKIINWNAKLKNLILCAVSIVKTLLL